MRDVGQSTLLLQVQEQEGYEETSRLDSKSSEAQEGMREVRALLAAIKH